MIPEDIKKSISDKLGVIHSFQQASGGCINNGGAISTSKGAFFIKWNNAKKYPDMFVAEAKGLDLLRQSQLIVPKVIDVLHNQEYQVLVLEHIESGSVTSKTWKDFGQKLALMHQISQPQYGLGHDNYMGSLNQVNQWHNTWIDFFIDQRLEPQLKISRENGLIDSSFEFKFQRLYKLLPDILSIEKPALVHGDLWSGNYMIDSNGNTVLIDPAVSFSHREVDLAMTKLFGGFSNDFYSSYQETCPTAKGLSERLDIYNLYPLLIHLNVFGSGYLSQIRSIVSRYD